MNKNENIYLLHAIRNVEKMREFSLKNADKTNLYSIEELHEFMQWYIKIITLMKSSPPDYFIKVIEIVENDKGDVQDIRYELYSKDEATKNTDNHKIELTISKKT